MLDFGFFNENRVVIDADEGEIYYIKYNLLCAGSS